MEAGGLDVGAGQGRLPLWCDVAMDVDEERERWCLCLVRRDGWR
jgi:hypothetical protein